MQGPRSIQSHQLTAQSHQCLGASRGRLRSPTSGTLRVEPAMGGEPRTRELNPVPHSHRIPCCEVAPNMSPPTHYRRHITYGNTVVEAVEREGARRLGEPIWRRGIVFFLDVVLWARIFQRDFVTSKTNCGNFRANLRNFHTNLTYLTLSEQRFH